MRFGIVLPPMRPWLELLQRARLVEKLGFDEVWVGDHFAGLQPGQPWLECWTALSALAQATRRIRIGSFVSSILLRGPQLLAKQALTADHISSGRLELGIGTGAARDCPPLGVDYPPAADRTRLLAEYVEMVDRLLRNPVTTYAGATYRAEGAPMFPGPVQKPRPPLVLAAESPSAIALAGRTADAWCCTACQPLRAERAIEFEEGVWRARSMLETLRAAGAAAGRSPGAVRPVVFAHRLGFEPLDAPELFGRFVDAYREAGFEGFVVAWGAQDPKRAARTLAAVSTDLLPRYRASPPD